METGFCVVHANHLETLATLLVEYSLQSPLSPLEQEIVLVQSNGMADWFKLWQAQSVGISAAMTFPMPSSFLWQMYQQVLEPEQLGKPSLFDKGPLQWRILKLLPSLLVQPAFARVNHFVKDDPQQAKRFQLAVKLADLFDQYQLYRADWIKAWEQGNLVGVGDDEVWQAQLWRALVANMPASERKHSRAHYHQAFIQKLAQGERPQCLPRRIFLFGINSLSRQLFEALHALSRHCQILLMVLSPCEHYWADKKPIAMDGFEPNNAILDSLGARGRDFLTLMLEYEPAEPDWLPPEEINPYAPAQDYTRADSMVCQLQQSMLDNGQPETGQPLPDNPGLAFYPAYSRQREVEILHDKLLSLFTEDPALQYNDIIVMTPDIERYAPHIEAVFNRYALDDPRRLSFAISDRQGYDTPLFSALDYLLDLPTQRLTRSELFSLLELPALQNKLGFVEEDLVLFDRWIEASHIRWGIDANHKRQVLDLDTEDTVAWRRHNTWREGLDQLLAGYCAGADTAGLFDTVSVDEVSANQGALLGKLVTLVDQIDTFRQKMETKQPPSAWATCFHDLLESFFAATTDRDQLLLEQLEGALVAWEEDCQHAGFDTPLPLDQARQGWLNNFKQTGMSQQLVFHGITFCTLMPMRALPFKHIFLLGMNDGDYPRQQQPVGFDLMNHDYRPGDRNRRDDDQYLFLEALMSVRDSLHISWVGYDINKGTSIPPCTLVGQLRDQVDAIWQTDEVDSDGHPFTASQLLTQTLPLSAFSRHYFEKHKTNHTSLPAKQMPHTWDKAWRALYAEPVQRADVHAPMTKDKQYLASEALSVTALVRVLKDPPAIFYKDRLQAMPYQKSEASGDDEAFNLNNLERWQLRNALLDDLLHDREIPRSHWLESGALPMGAFATRVLDEETRHAESIYMRWKAPLEEAQKQPAIKRHIELKAQGQTARLSVHIGNLWQHPTDGLIITSASASNFKKKKGWRWDKLAACWIQHLLASAAGLDVKTLVVARDSRVQFQSMGSARAHIELNRLLLVYYRAWQRPLLLTPDALVLPEPGDAMIPDKENELVEAMDAYWPDDETDQSQLSFFAELLFRPLQEAMV